MARSFRAARRSCWSGIWGRAVERQTKGSTVGYWGQTVRQRCVGRETQMPSRPGEFHPEPLTDPDVTLSRHPARATARRLPPSIECRAPPVAG